MNIMMTIKSKIINHFNVFNSIALKLGANSLSRTVLINNRRHCQDSQLAQIVLD